MRLIRGNVERVTESPQEQQLLIKEGYKPIDEEKETEAPHRQRNGEQVKQ